MHEVHVCNTCGKTAYDFYKEAPNPDKGETLETMPEIYICPDCIARFIKGSIHALINAEPDRSIKEIFSDETKRITIELNRKTIIIQPASDAAAPTHLSVEPGDYVVEKVGGTARPENVALVMECYNFFTDSRTYGVYEITTEDDFIAATDRFVHLVLGEGK